MSRNDSILYSGGNNRAQERRKEMTQQKARQSRALEPAIEQVNELVKKYYNQTGEVLLNIVDEDTTDDDVKAKLMAVRLYRKFLSDFRAELANIVRPAKKQKEATDETWE